MRIEPASAPDVDALAEAWVALAAEQRAHDSHLHAASNRDRIRESMAHHVVEGSVLVARSIDGDEDDSLSTDGDEDDSLSTDGDEDAVGGGGEAGEYRFVGFVTFSVDRGEYEMDAARGTVENLFVRPFARGEGVGAALLSAAEGALADRGVDVVSLEVLAANARAREFYDREGYDEQRVVVEKRVDVETATKGNRGQ